MNKDSLLKKLHKISNDDEKEKKDEKDLAFIFINTQNRRYPKAQNTFIGEPKKTKNLQDVEGILILIIFIHSFHFCNSRYLLT